ncbi:MAG TPA: F0F1 ATP synthase subunit delta [Patescibacteria group bacterium]|nr:F0F1 ATP synthase subunit delta [Patescibacteria group bacterium]
MDASLFTPFLTQLRTTAEANNVVEQIDEITNMFYKDNQIPISKLLSDRFPSDLSSTLEIILKNNNLTEGNPTVLKTFFERLQTAVRSCDVLSLTLAHNPTQTLLNNLSTYAKQTFGNKTILEINLDPTLIAGAIVTFQGNYLDASIKRKLEEYFTK